MTGETFMGDQPTAFQRAEWWWNSNDDDNNNNNNGLYNGCGDY